MSVDASRITALLGPTNTGKTHRAIEEMLSHDTGIIGLPLRLLAREVYDKVRARVGDAEVALVTGEERIAPPTARYVVATVESMPKRDVDFVCVDEIQLAQHEQRGHVFTERLLHARGRKVTYFLGSLAMAGVIRDLVPTATTETMPRLSRLVFAGDATLSEIPPRSALVAFSASSVYELAERVRQKRGGAAVVLGALSPRTRNAQVAMFQSGEVEHLVATDAIGMGLNLDLAHAALATTRKFDGRGPRSVTQEEIAQIAGRAGRHTKDGTFGTVAPLTLAPDLARAVEAHEVRPVERVYYRNADLDFSSLDALLASLRAPPRHRRLRLGPPHDDELAARSLAARPDVRRHVTGEDDVRRFFRVAQIPDFRQLGPGPHAAVLGEIWDELALRGFVSDDFLRERTDPLDAPEGIVDDLVHRIASIRTYTYLSYRDGWVKNAAEWQARTRGIEDRLSDALHETLVQRFVEKRSRHRRRAHDGPTLTQSPFLALERQKEQAAVEDFRLDLLLAPDDAFELDEPGALRFERRRVAMLRPGRELVLPEVKLLFEAPKGLGERLAEKLRATSRRLARRVAGNVEGLVDGLAPAAARAVTRELVAGLGIGPRGVLSRWIGAGADEAFRARGFVVGAAFVWDRDAFGDTAQRTRTALVNAHLDRPVQAPRGDSMPKGVLEPDAARALGYLETPRRYVRVDVLDGWLSLPDAQLAERLGVAVDELGAWAEVVTRTPSGTLAT